MRTRKAHARWGGDIKGGKGQVDFGNGPFKAPSSFTSRFENAAGTNPGELLGTAHCAISLVALAALFGKQHRNQPQS